MKSYTDLEQSKVLSKILPIASADMMWKKELKYRICSDEYKVSESDFIYYPTFKEERVILSNFDIPCWSLAALLSVLPDELEDNHFLTLDKEGAEYCCCYEDGNGNSFRYCFSDNPVDACVAMIEKLHELNLL